MIPHKMQLAPDEIEILDGKKGPIWQKILESIVQYGDAFNASKLVSITGAPHLVMSAGLRIIDPYFRRIKQFIEADIKLDKPFTVDPRVFDFENMKTPLIERLLCKIIYSYQAEYEQQLLKLGIRDLNAFTCACYLPEVGNIPKKGDILAWSESSAVVFANSVLGARSNRNSGGIDILYNIIKKIPEYGLITNEGRKAKWIVEVKTSTLPNPQLLGSAIGMKVIEDVPYIIGLDRFLGNDLTDQVKDYFKDFGAASASNGSVGLFHVENLTPEAKELQRELILPNAQKYEINDGELLRIKDNYPDIWKNPNAKPKMCFIGCPHLSYNQLNDWVEILSQELIKKGMKKFKVPTFLCTAPDIIEKVKKTDIYKKILRYGIKLTSVCPFVYSSNPITANRPIITNSNKLRTYTNARFFLDKELIPILLSGVIPKKSKILPDEAIFQCLHPNELITIRDLVIRMKFTDMQVARYLQIKLNQLVQQKKLVIEFKEGKNYYALAPSTLMLNSKNIDTIKFISSKQFKGRPILPGKVSGEAVVSLKGFNTLATYKKAFFNKEGIAICADQGNSELFGKILSNKIIILPTTIGSTTGGLIIEAIADLGMGPIALLFSEKIDSLAAGGVILTDIWAGKRIITIDQLGDEFLHTVKNGQKIEISEDGTVTIE